MFSFIIKFEQNISYISEGKFKLTPTVLSRLQKHFFLSKHLKVKLYFKYVDYNPLT